MSKKNTKSKTKVGAPKDRDGKRVEIGCSLRSKMYPTNKVVCENIVDGGVWLRQEQSGSMAFFIDNVTLKNSQWVVFKYPDKKDG